MITNNMKKVAALVFVALAQCGQAADDFNYRETNGRDYGPKDWDEVSCNNLSGCVSFSPRHYQKHYLATLLISCSVMFCKNSLDGQINTLDPLGGSSLIGPTTAVGVPSKEITVDNIANRQLISIVIALIQIVPTGRSARIGIGE